jgi:hypothetical protein
LVEALNDIEKNVLITILLCISITAISYLNYQVKTYKNGEHAEVCLYSVKTPEGEIIKDIDLAEANGLIFYSNYNEKHPSDNYELDLMDNR